MDVTNLAQFIQQVGFPVVMCVLLFYQNTKSTEALNNNTTAIESMRIFIETKFGEKILMEQEEKEKND